MEATDAQLGIMRVLIPDTEEVFDGETLFEDKDLQNYFTAGGGSVLRAAGLAVLAISNSEALISKVIGTQDLQTDGAKVAEAMRKNAQLLFDRADAEEAQADSFYFNVVDYGGTWERPELTEWNWGVR